MLIITVMHVLCYVDTSYLYLVRLCQIQNYAVYCIVTQWLIIKVTFFDNYYQWSYFSTINKKQFEINKVFVCKFGHIMIAN